MKKRIVAIVFLIIVVVLIAVTAMTPGTIADPENYQCGAYATILSLLPPVIAIVLALITKEVYSSLFAGVVVGALLYANFNLELMVNTMFYSGNGLVYKIADSWNAGIIIFLIMLGILVALMNKAGGSAAFGKWASKRIKSRVGAQLATLVLGVLIFVDDYFNCLTVGSVMRPVTDRHKISRAKLAYVIDATAAPVCIIAPISSWAAAVTSSVPEDSGINGFSVFLQTIPFNLYALLSIVMMIVLIVSKTDYGPMRKHELNALKGDLFTTPDRPYDESNEVADSSKAHVLDLVLPIIVLIAACILCMVYTGGFFGGEPFISAFANCDASMGLVLGGFIALMFTFVYYMLRNIISFKDMTDCIPEGFKAMIAPVLILAFAWTLSGMTNLLGADVFVAGVVAGSAQALLGFLPVIIFLIAAGLAFATGTSWGTFGILIPIVVGVFPEGQMMVISIAACLAGAVCGDHCSPISDTTIMASAGAHCNHINHVSTQIPYAVTVLVVSAIGYAIMGVFYAVGAAGAAIAGLPISIVILFVVLMMLRKKAGKVEVSAE